MNEKHGGALVAVGIAKLKGREYGERRGLDVAGSLDGSQELACAVTVSAERERARQVRTPGVGEVGTEVVQSHHGRPLWRVHQREDVARICGEIECTVVQRLVCEAYQHLFIGLAHGGGDGVSGAVRFGKEVAGVGGEGVVDLPHVVPYPVAAVVEHRADACDCGLDLGDYGFGGEGVIDCEAREDAAGVDERECGGGCLLKAAVRVGYEILHGGDELRVVRVVCADGARDCRRKHIFGHGECLRFAGRQHERLKRRHERHGGADGDFNGLDVCLPCAFCGEYGGPVANCLRRLYGEAQRLAAASFHLERLFSCFADERGGERYGAGDFGVGAAHVVHGEREFRRVAAGEEARGVGLGDDFGADLDAVRCGTGCARCPGDGGDAHFPGELRQRENACAVFTDAASERGRLADGLEAARGDRADAPHHGRGVVAADFCGSGGKRFIGDGHQHAEEVAESCLRFAWGREERVWTGDLFVRKDVNRLVRGKHRCVACLAGRRAGYREGRRDARAAFNDLHGWGAADFEAVCGAIHFQQGGSRRAMCAPRLLRLGGADERCGGVDVWIHFGCDGDFDDCGCVRHFEQGRADDAFALDCEHGHAGEGRCDAEFGGVSCLIGILVELHFKLRRV